MRAIIAPFGSGSAYARNLYLNKIAPKHRIHHGEFRRPAGRTVQGFVACQAAREV
jgi:hypothetical protein